MRRPMSSRDPAPDYFLSVLSLFSLARNLRVIIGDPAWRNFSFKPADHLAPDEASFCRFQLLYLWLSAYLYFRYIVVSPWQWRIGWRMEVSGGGMRHNANTVTLRSHPQPGPGAAYFVRHILHVPGLLGGLSIILWQSVPCFDLQTRGGSSLQK